MPPAREDTPGVLSGCPWQPTAIQDDPMLFLVQDLSAKVASVSVRRGRGLAPTHAASRSEVSHEGEDELCGMAAFKASKALLQYKTVVVA
jgi:hypothetical protein